LVETVDFANPASVLTFFRLIVVIWITSLLIGSL
jgi:hypothetical protein